jgi:hypothetical protein
MYEHLLRVRMLNFPGRCTGRWHVALCGPGMAFSASPHAPAMHAVEQRLVVWMFGMTVIGMLWTWPLMLFLATRSAVVAAAVFA